ncbi:MAG: hypothetical protein NVSMB21_17290 [Vulcanimicrobiaceae bacterium]
MFGAALAPSGPCAYVTRADVVALLHWGSGTGREVAYRLPQARGAVCRYEASEGTVLVTVPERGSSFFNNNDLVDPFKNGMGSRVAGIGATVTMFDNTAYINRGGRSVSVAVLPTSGAADERILAAFARRVARRMR